MPYKRGETKTIQVNATIHESLGKLAEDVQEKENRSTKIGRPELIERMMPVYRKSLGL